MEVRRPLFLVFLLLLCETAPAAQWVTLGPDGGDARSLASDPRHPDHVFLGTSTGTIFHSVNGGQSWTPFAHLGKANDYVIDHIVVDRRDSGHIYVAAWSLTNHQSGDLFESGDAGQHWRKIPAMHGKSIRGIAVAPTEANVLVVGTLDGVFRSKDGGQQWEKISRRRTDIKNVESIALDPRNSNVIYAGTWHLAWKTSDGGASWRRIQEGVIDDSDIFSIIVDQSNSQTIFASACSGIYKSTDGGSKFDRTLEIPFSARRTHVLKQDPNDSAVVYAGTTEGLWVTKDSGATWKRVTGPDVVINDVLIDPGDSNRVLLAGDRVGVLATIGTELNFQPSNAGFSHRYISSILIDKDNADTIYVGVVNDREFGGVFVSEDAGRHWEQRNTGLDGRDVFALKQASDGNILAGTNRGLFAFVRGGSEWKSLSDTLGKNPTKPTPSGSVDSLASLRVNDIEVTPKKWFAATAAGLYISSDEGRTWARDNGIGKLYLVAVRAKNDHIVVASPRKVLAPAQNGSKWRGLSGLPAYIDSIHSLAITPHEEIVIGTSQGAFRRLNAGWSRMQFGPSGKDISFVSYDESYQRLLAVSSESGAVFESKDGGRRWRRESDAGYPLRCLAVAGGRLIAATLFDGVVLRTISAHQVH